MYGELPNLKGTNFSIKDDRNSPDGLCPFVLA
jgi:hypothetical protein